MMMWRRLIKAVDDSGMVSDVGSLLRAASGVLISLQGVCFRRLLDKFDFG